MEIKDAMEDEIRFAHQIIKNALNLMTPAQKNKWAKLNAQDGCDGEGATRANERLLVLDRLMRGE